MASDKSGTLTVAPINWGHKILRIHPSVIVSVLDSLRGLVDANGWTSFPKLIDASLPPDCEIVDFWHNYDLNQFEIVLAHESFPPVPPGTVPPAITPELFRHIVPDTLMAKHLPKFGSWSMLGELPSTTFAADQATAVTNPPAIAETEAPQLAEPTESEGKPIKFREFL